jgi:hypothetical protein
MLTIGYIHAGTVREETLQSLLRAVVGDLLDRRVISGVLGVPTTYHAHGRNALCAQFLASDDRWLLMVDTDMVFTLADIYALLDADKPVIAGLYLSRHEDHPPVWATGDHQRFTEIPTHPIRLGSAGTGFMLIERQVLEKVVAEHTGDPWPWFGHDVIGAVRAGEDVSFCHRLAQLDIELWGHGGVQLGHIGTTALWPVEHQEVRQ